MKTKLEKMQKIAQAGFVPDMWTLPLTDSNGNQFYAYTAYQYCHEDKPNNEAYFTESKLWSILPAKLADGCYFEMTKDLSCAFMGYLSKFVDEKDAINLEIKEGDSLHDALLDLVLWAIAEGHLVKEKE